MSFDYREFEQLLNSFKEVQQQHEKFLREFLLEMGLRTLAQTKKLTPVDTGELRGRWELSEVYRNGDSLYIVISNTMEYASYVEDGRMQRARFVPGKWVNNRFVYESGAKEGMVLKDKWIPGHHMARISITKIENEIPARYNRALKEFMKGLGAAE